MSGIHDLKLKIVIFKPLKNLGIGLRFHTHCQNYGFGHPPALTAKAGIFAGKAGIQQVLRVQGFENLLLKTCTNGIPAYSAILG